MPLILDTVHGNIEIDKNDLVFLDNRWLKRLKRVKQLGLLDHVFPSGSHSRFEHVVGVYHLANTYTAQLEKNSNKKLFTDKEKRCIKLAALFHDLGHGPYSHVFDHFLENFDSEGLVHSHEERSQLIVEKIFKETQPSGFNGYDIDMIKNMIEPPEHMIIENSGMKTYNCEKPYIYELVNNKLNGIDIDRFDYLQRDAKHIGLDYAFNPERIFYKSFVKDKRILYDVSLKNNIFDMFYTRYRFHKDIYNHKTVKMIELMISDALIEVNNCENCPLEDKFVEMCSLDQGSIKDEYLYLDDSIYTKFLSNKNKCENRTKSSDLINRIENRQLYKLKYYGKYSDGLMDKFPNCHKVDIKFTLSSLKNNTLENTLFHNKFTDKVEYGTIDNRLIPNDTEEEITMIYDKKI